MPGLPPVGRCKYQPMICSFMGALLLMAGIMWSAPSLRAGTSNNVTAKDSAELIAAISAANQSFKTTFKTTIISLDGNADYKFNLPTSAPEPISSHIIIRGEGAHLVGDGNRNFGTLFIITNQGFLELTDLVIRDFDSGDDDSRVSQDGLIVNTGVLVGRNLRFERIRARSNRRILGGAVKNWGYLDFDRVRIVDVSVSEQGVLGLGAIAIYNLGEARLQNLLIIDSSGHDPTIAGPVGNYILNFGSGQLNLTYSSLISKSKSAGSLSLVQAFVQGATGPGHSLMPQVSIFGSMIVDMQCPIFNGTRFASKGFNLFTDKVCSGQSGGPTDLIGVSPGTLQFRQGADGGLEIVLPQGSPALDAVQGPGITCPGRDVINTARFQDADLDGVALCDIGAFEKPAGTPLFNGGANGIFYSASLDGHYVTIQEVRPNVYVVFWNTFDLDGNQAWVWAMGNRVGDTISAKAFIMPVGMLIPGSGAAVDTSALQSWGTVDVQLTGCLAGRFTYTSALAQFGSGSFNLDRLALIEGLGCQD